jgi:hypothetical protein
LQDFEPRRYDREQGAVLSRISDLSRTLALATALAALAGCASVGAEFSPYPHSTPHPPMLERAVVVERHDVPDLARAGAIIVGNITAGGNGFADPHVVLDDAAREAAQRGGTHLVVETPLPRAYQPSAPVTLKFTVIRLGDINSMAQLPARLQPRRGVHYQGQLAINWSEVEYTPPKPLANAEPARPQTVVNGSHLKPLQ